MSLLTTTCNIDLVCPICNKPFVSQELSGEPVVLRKRLDFYEHVSGNSPLRFMIHVCPVCAFAGTKRDFESPSVVECRDSVRARLERIKRNSLKTNSDKFEHAARIAPALDVCVRYIGDMYLRASWCCVLEEDTEAERYFQRKAAEDFDEALASYDTVDQDERAVLTYLAAELYRRSGRADRAHELFAKVSYEVTSPESQDWVVKKAEQQSSFPKEWF